MEWNVICHYASIGILTRSAEMAISWLIAVIYPVKDNYQLLIRSKSHVHYDFPKNFSSDLWKDYLWLEKWIEEMKELIET
jgi:hypothetical protein